jgi:hypothetical protein
MCPDSHQAPIVDAVRLDQHIVRYLTRSVVISIVLWLLIAVILVSKKALQIELFSNVVYNIF